MIREEIPLIIFVSIIIIISVVAFFQIFKNHEEKISNIYLHKQALSILERKISEFQDGFVLKKEINQTIWSKGFISFLEKDVKKENLLKISLPVLIGNSTNAGRVSIYVWR